jgi:hypothetical protein
VQLGELFVQPLHCKVEEDRTKRSDMSHTLSFTVRLRIQPAKFSGVGLRVQFMLLAISSKFTTVPPSCNGPLTLRNSLGPLGVVRARQELI